MEKNRINLTLQVQNDLVELILTGKIETST